MSRAVVKFPRDATAIELPPHKLVEARDLYRIPLWFGRKALYTLAPVPLLFRLARARAAVRWFVPRTRRRMVARMERFFGETKSHAEVRRIARRHLQYVERQHLARLWPYVQGFAGRASCPVEGLEHLDAALAAGRGAILATMHFGYGRLIKPLLEPSGYTAWVVGNTGTGISVPSPFTQVGLLVHSRVLRLPRIMRPDLADLQAGINLRPLLGALSRNEVLILPLDAPGPHGLGRHGSLRPVPVLGNNVLFAPGPISMARATCAPLLPAFVVDSDDGGGIGMRLEIRPPLELQRSDRPTEDLDANLERFAVVFEEYLRRYPHLFSCESSGPSESLRVGEQVKVRGRRDGGSFVAFTVKIRPSRPRTRIIGPIDEVDEHLGLLRILGRDAHLSSGCEVVDRAGAPISLRDFAVGDVVEVTGTYSGAEGFVASGVQVSYRPHLQELQGIVESVSADRRTFEVLGFPVTTTEATKIKDQTDRRPTAGSPKRTRTNGSAWLRGATSAPGGVPNLETGMRVKVKGHTQEDGSFVALEVGIRRPAAKAEIKAAIEHIDPDLGVVRVLHRDIALSSSCQITGRSGQSFSASELAAGDTVRLAGPYSTEEGFAARSVRVSRSGDLEELVGTIESFDRDRRSFDVLGFSVHLTENTKVRLRSPDLIVGDPAPVFELPKVDGRATGGEIVRIPDDARKQPTVLLFGSYTCPLARRLIAAVGEPYECFQDRLAFFLVYIREAHPEGRRLLRENQELGISVREPTFDAERTLIAEKCALELGVRMPVLIDTVEDRVADLYGAWPARLYLIGADGRIAHAGGSGPVPDDAEMMRQYTERELDQLRVAIERELAGQVR